VCEENALVGSQQVIDAWGYWPSFHDAEVISFSVERALPFESGHAIARLSVHIRRYEVVGEGTVNYKQALRASVLVRFVFNGACELALTDFNHQNVINAIRVSTFSSESGKSESRLLIEIDPIWGFGGTFQCKSAAVEAVEILSNTET